MCVCVGFTLALNASTIHFTYKIILNQGKEERKLTQIKRGLTLK